ncbi:HAMP domain-containing sensor histidine kinase [Thermus amyloliquefaciens]|uniref:HAMP domain-containing sensor histidine kinase n=1 Tax=Thermus amyloliquefaciens TaxID=1449080 RepID=UPI00068D7B66|nr:HAMP domain-containing sensor histidine kinase [Thermus amyloliquefaciens]
MSLTARLALAMALVALLVAGLSGFLAYRAASSHLERAMALGLGPAAPAPRLGLRERRILQELRGAVAVSSGAALLMGLGAGLLLALGLVRPVRELAQTAEAYRRGDRTRRAQVQGQDEVAGLAQSFNQLLDELARKEAEEKRLLADIAHDLRTPLTVLQGDLEALEDGLLPCTPEHLRRLQEEVRLLGRLVEDLRLLTLAESGGLRLTPERLDAQSLVRGVLEAHAAKAAAKGVDLQLRGKAPPLLADREALQRVLHNLLDNAIRHTPAGGRVEVSLEEEGSGVRLAVWDTGPGLKPGEEERVFQRFYRGDPARGRGGSGLGLSIAKSLVEAMGGRIQAGNHPEGGALFVLWLPRGDDVYAPFTPGG